MIDNLRRLSKADASAAAEKIALKYATTVGIKGKLLGVEPDSDSSERRGKTPVHWAAVFESVMDQSVIDGPLVVSINLELGTASAIASA